MKTYAKWLFAVTCLCCVPCLADTFKHKESGESFTGFATQKVTAGYTLVYHAEEGKMQRVKLEEYEITQDTKGRRDTVSLLTLNQPEVFLSKGVSEKTAAAIIAASNKGPQAILIQIDGPGGNREYMKTIADAILQTTNCPVIAFVSEGAYSATAVTAIACDKVYMKSSAGIGAVGPAEGDLPYADYLSIFCSDDLLQDIPYVTTLAQRNERPVLLAKALLDKRISIVEVSNMDGSRVFVGKEDRMPTQTLIRTLCEGITETGAELKSPADVVGRVIHLTAKDAVDTGLVNGTAESIDEVMAALGLADAKKGPVPGIDKEIKKYTAARRNITDALYEIEQIEKDVADLTDQFTTIDEHLRKGTQTREVGREDPGYRSTRRRDRLPDDYGNYYYGDEYENRNRGTRTRRSYQKTRTADPDPYARRERVTREEPLVNIGQVYDQLLGAYEALLGEYHRTLQLVDRWPGALPPKLTRTKLQEDMDSAEAELDRLRRYTPVYPDQQGTESKRTRTGERRGNY